MAVTDRDTEIANLHRQIGERDAAIADREAHIVERDAQIVEQEARIAKRDALSGVNRVIIPILGQIRVKEGVPRIVIPTPASTE